MAPSEDNDAFLDRLHKEARRKSRQGIARFEEWYRSVFEPTISLPNWGAEHLIVWLDDPTLGFNKMMFGTELRGTNVHRPTMLDDRYHDNAGTLILHACEHDTSRCSAARIAVALKSALNTWCVGMATDQLRVGYGLLTLAADESLQTPPYLLRNLLDRRGLPYVLEPMLLECLITRQLPGMSGVWEPMVRTARFPRLTAEGYESVYHASRPGATTYANAAIRLGRRGMFGYFKYLYERAPAQTLPAQHTLIRRVGGFIGHCTASGHAPREVWSNCTELFKTEYCGIITTDGERSHSSNYPGTYTDAFYSELFAYGERHGWPRELLEYAEKKLTFRYV